MDKPFLPLLASLILGILIGNHYDINLLYPIGFLIIALIILIYNIYKNKKSLFTILIVFILIGISITSLKAESRISQYADLRMEYIGVVEDVLAGDDNRLSRYIVKIESNLDHERKIDERIRLNVIGAKTLQYGDKIIFDGLIEEPLANTNPMLYNHRLNLLSNNIYASMTINDYSLRIVEGEKDFKYQVKEGFHLQVNRIFDTYLDDENSQIIKSIILGDSSYLMEDQLVKYRELGLGHILAVSGLHIGIIASFILYSLRALTIPRKISCLITIVILIIYGFLIGFPQSLLRATLMFSILILTKLSSEHINTINALSLSAFITLLINPFSLYSLSFILSYTAVLSILTLAKRIENISYPRKGYLVKSLSGILGVNIGLLPIQAYFFNYVSLLGIISNLLIIPIFSISLILSICLLLANYIMPFLIPGLAIVLNLLLGIVSSTSHILHKIPGLVFNIGSPSLFAILAYYVFIGLLFKLIDISFLKYNLRKTILIFISFILLVNFSYLVLDKSLEIHFIDVGQGDSILFRTKDRNILLDTGGSLYSNYVNDQIVIPYLQKLGVNRLDGLIISHFDADHAGGIRGLMDKLKINNIYASYIPDDQDLYEDIMKNKIPFILVKAGDRLNINNDISFDVLWPDDDVKSLSPNDKSLGLLLNYDDYKLFFGGDIERQAEIRLVEYIPSNIDVLKVAHHGSQTSSINEFLEIARPHTSIISVGPNNQYNHPSPQVIDRLESVKTTIYRTDTMGLIKIHLDNDIQVQPFIDGARNSIIESVYEKSWVLTFYLFYYIILKRLIIIYEKYGVDNYELWRL